MIVFGSRGSDLALTQTRQVAERLAAATGARWRIRVIETRGDRILDKPLAEIGGKGLFTEELEAALRDGTIDAAVHSLKDLPVDDPPGLTIGAIPQRVDARDVLVFTPNAHDPEGGTVPLAGGSRIGTSSPRRRAALRALRPDLDIVDLRGNVPTRVDKVRHGDLDAVVLAAAGLDRLALDLGDDLLRVPLTPAAMPPAPGQGALAVQCRANDTRTLERLAKLHDPVTAACVRAERDVLAALGGGCSLPFGALFAHAADGERFTGVTALFATDGSGAGVFEAIDDAASPTALAAACSERLAPLAGEPLRGVTVTLVRPGGASGRLGAALRVAGAEVRSVAVTESLPIAATDDVVHDAAAATAIAFTSARAVDRWCEELAVHGVASAFADKPLFAGGPATARALRDRGLNATSPADDAGGGEALARLAIGQLETGARVLFPCAAERHDGFETELAAAGIDVVPVPVYRTVPLADVELPSAADTVGTVLFTAPSAVAAWHAAAGSLPARVAAIGATTAAALRAIDADGLADAAVADAPTPAGVLAMLRRLATDG